MEYLASIWPKGIRNSWDALTVFRILTDKINVQHMIPIRECVRVCLVPAIFKVHRVSRRNLIRLKFWLISFNGCNKLLWYRLISFPLPFKTLEIDNCKESKSSREDAVAVVQTTPLLHAFWWCMIHNYYTSFFLFIWEHFIDKKMFCHPHTPIPKICSQVCQKHVNKSLSEKENTWNIYCIWNRRRFVSWCEAGKLRSWRATVLQSLAPTLIKHTCM